jgi:hypothetical protein
MVSLELAQGKRVEELVVLQQLLKKSTFTGTELVQIVKKGVWI